MVVLRRASVAVARGMLRVTIVLADGSLPPLTVLAVVTFG